MYRRAQTTECKTKAETKGPGPDRRGPEAFLKPLAWNLGKPYLGINLSRSVEGLGVTAFMCFSSRRLSEDANHFSVTASRL